ncbi:MAG TPA: hypothetical protein VMV86_06520 [Methanosarcinales archaeon]|nr:hypothetical protein [Methanosarcinales archaeon]
MKLWRMRRWLRDTCLYTYIFGGRCVGCGSHARRWCFKNKWVVCKNCDTDEILDSIADHVMDPNGDGS